MAYIEVSRSAGSASSGRPVNAGPTTVRRSPIARMLWGATAEHCAECGVEVAPKQAYRFASELYCSIEHAKLDRDS